jgi:hypothetical protein
MASGRWGRALGVLGWLLVAMGAVLRLDQYAAGRSLWLDEALLAVNFHDRTWLEILRPPLDYHDRLTAPPGFLVATAALVGLAGLSDPVLRLIPLAGGLVSLWLFLRVARLTLAPAAVPIAVLLFALSPRLVYYASEVKQYSTDVTVALALFLLAVPLTRGPAPRRALLALGAAGAVAPWLSHPSAFVLAGAWLVLAARHGFGRRREATIALGVIGLAWLGSVAGVYAVTVRNVPAVSPASAYLIGYWRDDGAFLTPSLSLAALAWGPRTLARLLEYAGIPLALGGIVGLAGCLSLLVRARALAAVLLLPMVVAMALSPLERYPVAGRLLLFLFPVVHLVMAEGIGRLRLPRAAGPRVALVTAAVHLAVVAGLVSTPVYHRRYGQEFEPVLAHVGRHRQPGDVVYLYHWSEPAFRHYAGRHGFRYDDCRLITPIPAGRHLKEIDYYRGKRGMRPADVAAASCVLGVAETHDQARGDLEGLRGRGRVWVLFSHIDHNRARFLEHLDRIGTRLDRVARRGAWAYLYVL